MAHSIVSAFGTLHDELCHKFARVTPVLRTLVGPDSLLLHCPFVSLSLLFFPCLSPLVSGTSDQLSVLTAPYGPPLGPSDWSAPLVAFPARLVGHFASLCLKDMSGSCWLSSLRNITSDASPSYSPPPPCSSSWNCIRSESGRIMERAKSAAGLSLSANKPS